MSTSRIRTSATPEVRRHGSAELESTAPTGPAIYGRMCGWMLARSHACSGDGIAIAGYLGGSARFDGVIARFAEAY
ncbi:MAG TPA: DUF2252 family protein [Solirubrobacteraceae bacterium]|jgi:hypothetical protein|nr:DUF2252 family protein [Solirubrobacteraceae bacterium]